MKQVALTFLMLLALPLSPLEVSADDGHGAEKLSVTVLGKPSLGTKFLGGM